MTKTTKADPGLREYATDRQWECLEAMAEHGSFRKAAAAMGVHHEAVRQACRAVRQKAARAGYAPEAGWDTPVPEGYAIHGVSTLRGPDGEVKARWEKVNRDAEAQKAIFEQMVEAFKDELPRYKPTKQAKSLPASDALLACYPVSDHHLGMLSWGEETGADYDLTIGQKLLDDATTYLVETAPACPQALVAILGDFLHYDGFDAITPTNKNQLDSDTRYQRMVRAAIWSARMVIDKAAVRHGKVRVIISTGNHDLATSVFLRECLASVYEGDPRIEIDTSPSMFHYFEWGANLIGVHHGHGTKLDKLPIVMASDCAEAWGRTRYRYWWTGHIHKDTVLDIEGTRVESFRILPPTDAWAHGAGYRPGRDMKAILLHRDYGEVARFVVNPHMLEDGSEA